MTEIFTLTKLNKTYNSIRITEGYFEPIKWTLKADIIPTDYLDRDISEVDFSVAERALQKILFFTEAMLEDLLIITHNDKWAYNLAMKSQNSVLMLPHDASEEMLSFALHSKLNVIADGALSVDLIEISNVESPISHSFSLISGNTFLPDITSIIGKKAYHDTPWWGRNDTFTYDKYPGKDKELENPPEEMVTFEDLFDYSPSDDHTSRPKAGEVIKLDKWKPKLV